MKGEAEGPGHPSRLAAGRRRSAMPGGRGRRAAAAGWLDGVAPLPGGALWMWLLAGANARLGDQGRGNGAADDRGDEEGHRAVLPGGGSASDTALI